MDRSMVGLLTDFGHQDTYVGLMKCIMTDICPDARLIDLCHEVPPQNILSAAYLADTVVPHLPDGGVLMAVIDPGVGSGRRAIAVEIGSNYLVGPDNGLFELILRHRSTDRIVALESEEYFRSVVSSTFHGRDIFAPVSAHLAAGVDIDALGPSVQPQDLETLPSSDPFFRDNRIEAHVIHVDRFGNLISNLARDEMEEWLDGSEPEIAIEDQERPIDLKATFAESVGGRPLAYFGSTDQLEIAVTNGSAERYFGANQGTTIFIQRTE